MSKGVVHARASVALSIGFLIGSLWWGNGILYAIGALIGVFISPDQDVDAGNLSNTVIKKKLGWFGNSIWNGIWHMYRRSIKHGSELSHFPVVGTTGRILYLYSLLIFAPHVLVVLLFHPSWELWSVLSWYAYNILLGYKIILGLMGADLIHWGLDVMTTEHKRK